MLRARVRMHCEWEKLTIPRGKNRSHRPPLVGPALTAHGWPPPPIKTKPQALSLHRVSSSSPLSHFTRVRRPPPYADLPLQQAASTRPSRQGICALRRAPPQRGPASLPTSSPCSGTRSSAPRRAPALCATAASLDLDHLLQATRRPSRCCKQGSHMLPAAGGCCYRLWTELLPAYFVGGSMLP
jgi:hypothetical protein